MMRDFFSKADLLIQNPFIKEAFGLCREGEKSYLSWSEPGLPQIEFPSLHLNTFYNDSMLDSPLWSDFQGERDVRGTHSLQFIGNIPPIEYTKATYRLWNQDKIAWNNLCEKIHLGIQNGEFKKIVPARYRQSFLNDDKKIVLENLFHKISHKAAPGSFCFFFKRGESLFFGITPELLFQRKNNEIYVPAIAGTISLKENAEEAEKTLLSSAKDREEHAFVVEGILTALAKLGLSPLASTEPKVLRLKNLAHLYTPIYAHDPGKNTLSNKALIEALHPTPAIGGFPKDAAMQFLSKEEPWDRGLFSSPLLFSFPEEDLCLVAIRSALIQKNIFTQFAGAGFVKNSIAESEWIETEQKMQALASILFES